MVNWWLLQVPRWFLVLHHESIQLQHRRISHINTNSMASLHALENSQSAIRQKLIKQRHVEQKCQNIQQLSKTYTFPLIPIFPKRSWNSQIFPDEWSPSIHATSTVKQRHSHCVPFSGYWSNDNRHKTSCLFVWILNECITNVSAVLPTQ